VSKKVKTPPANQGSRIKVDQAQGGGSTQAELLRFSFKFFRHECLEGCDKSEIEAFGKRLRALSTMTWQQVTQADRHGLGHEQITRGQILVPLDKLGEDVTFVLSFRYGHGHNPMLGHRDGATLHILWVSHGHEAYNG
jgi:hypothetical protein